jgi:D-arabinonate dehydratase
MKIVDVTVRTYRWQRPRELSNGLHTSDTVTRCVVQVHADDGSIGIGFGDQGPTEAVFAAMIDVFKPTVVGQDPLDTERLWAMLWSPKILGRRGFETRVLSILDIAIWDLKAKFLGQPLYKLLGAAQTSIPFYMAGGYYEPGKSLSDLGDEMQDYVAQGARAVKMKVGRLASKQDAERVAVVRQAIGPDVKLLVDANCAYRPTEAIEFARRIEDLDIFWFEEPVQPDDYLGYRKVCDNVAMPVAGGENEATRYGFRDLIDSGGVDVINADAQILGGISEFLKVAAYAQARGVAVAPHGNQDIHIHLVAALTNGLIVEYYSGSTDPVHGQFFRQHLEIHDGFVSPPDRPGLGIEVDFESIEAARIR